MKKYLKYAMLVMTLLFMTVTLPSCGGDDDEPTPAPTSILGTWECSEEYEDEDEVASIKMELKFNKDNTGSITETWSASTKTKASSTETYSMKFSWATTMNSDGNEILKISYISGDKNTELFPGTSSTVLWQRQYILTGNILNVFGGDGVWVFKRK